MKLIITIVNSDDSHTLLNELNHNGYTVTKLATTGGFLRSGNTTLLTGVEDEKVDEVIKIIESKCQVRKQITTTMLPVSGVMPFPIEVEVGGATVFVIDIEKYLKL